jgi:type IV secretory pathway VirJ component
MHHPIALLLPVFTVLDIDAADGEKISFGRFGEVTVYRQIQAPEHVVLFVSGDGGWNSGVIDMAQSLVALDSVVIGIDIVHYLREIARSGEYCTYSAADFENLSHFVQKKIGLPRYIPPVLIGYSSGATLVYAVLAQAPAGTYKGALSMGFCPDLPLNKPFCPGSAGLQCQPGPQGKGYSFLPARQLKTKWIAFQGDIDQVCDPAATEKFINQISTASIVKLPKVGHGFSVQKNWLPQFKQAFADLHDKKEALEQENIRQNISDLPVHEVPAAMGPGATMAVIYTGDGGWAGIDRELAQALSAAGLSVVGLDTL